MAWNAQEEARKKRTAWGKSQGLDDATIQKYELVLSVQDRQKKQATVQPQQPKPEQKPQGAFRSNSLLGFGTSLLPFGEVLRKKMNNEKITGGDVALETALTALPLAGKLVGKGVKAVKGLTAAQKAAKVVGKTADVANDVNKEKNLLKALLKGDPTEGAISGRLTRGGESLKAQARGVVPGVKPQGAAEKLLPSQADEINKTLNTVERKKTIFGRTKTGARGGVNKQLRTVETAQQKALTDMDSILDAQNVPIRGKAPQVGKTDSVSNTIIKGMREERKGILGLKKTHLEEAKDLESRVAKAKDVKELEALRRSADKRINFARNPNSPDPALEEIYLSLRRNIDNETTKLIPDLKVAKTNYGKLESAKDTLIQSSPATLKAAGGRGVTGMVLNNGVAQSGLDRAGRVLTRTGKITASPITKQAGVRLPFSTASAIGAGQPPADQSQLPADPSLLFAEPQNTDEDTINKLVQAGVTDPQKMFDALSGQGDYAQDPNAGVDEMGNATPIGASSAELFKMALDTRIAGDVKGSKDLLDFAKVAQQFEAASAKAGTSKPIKKTEGQRARDEAHQLTNKAIQQLSQGSVDTGWLGAKIQGTKEFLGKGDPETLGFNTTVSALKAAIAKARAGTSFTPNEEKLLNAYAPKAGDTGQQLETKLLSLKQVFEEAEAREYNTDQSGGSTNMFDFSDDELVQQLTEQRGY